VAFVVLRDGAAPTTEAQLIEYCRERLAAYKYPRVVYLRSELPQNSTGKILKLLLKQEVLAEAAAPGTIELIDEPIPKGTS